MFLCSFESWLRHRLADFSHFQEVLLGNILGQVRKREVIQVLSKTIHRVRKDHGRRIDSESRKEILYVIGQHTVDQQRYLNVFFSRIGAVSDLQVIHILKWSLSMC
jgi:hypothetical protein